MKRTRFVIAAFTVLSCLIGFAVSADVEFVRGDNRIDIRIDGTLAATYRYGPDLTKPIIFPIYSPGGIRVTRGFPLEEIEGESQDHPHHTGFFFTVDEVNGNKFWGNTKGFPSIRQREITGVKGGKSGTISAIYDWIGGNGKPVLKERRTMVFLPGAKEYSVDCTMRLTAVDTTVTFGDTKEGMFAVRVAPFLKEKDGTGKYLSSRGGKSAKDIWGRRTEWVRLEGTTGGSVAGIVIMNHPESVNFPTFWHARDYGLFSANPLGQSVFQKGTGMENPEPYNLTLKPGESALFRFRMTVYDGPRSQETLDRAYETYSKGQ